MLTRFQFKLYVIFETLIIPVQTWKKIKFSCYTRWKFVDLFEFEAQFDFTGQVVILFDCPRCLRSNDKSLAKTRGNFSFLFFSRPTSQFYIFHSIFSYRARFIPEIYSRAGYTSRVTHSSVQKCCYIHRGQPRASNIKIDGPTNGTTSVAARNIFHR